MKKFYSLLFGVCLAACDDVTPVSIELVTSDEDPFANIQTLIFRADDNNANDISQSFSVDEKKLELPLIPYGEGWVFSLEGRSEDTPIAFGQSIPVTLSSQREVNVKIFFGQINSFHSLPNQPKHTLSPLLLGGLPPLSVDVCSHQENRVSFIGGDFPQAFDAAQLSFEDSNLGITRLGSLCTSLGSNSLVVGGVLDATATEFSPELGVVDSEELNAQRMASPTLARIGHQTNTVVVPAGQTTTLPDGTILEGGTSLILVSGGKNNQQVFSQISLLIVSPDQELSLYEPSNSSKKIFISPRVAHSATLVQNENQSRILFAGGLDGAGAPLNTTEFLDLKTFEVTSGPNMIQARAGHRSVVVPNGDIVFFGGQNAQQESLASIERFSPRFEGFVEEPEMLFSRRGHSATLLESGLILIVGGIGKRVGTFGEEQTLSSGELFNPTDALQSGSLFTRELTEPRAGHAAVALSNNMVLVVGGTAGIDRTAELYIPVPERQ